MPHYRLTFVWGHGPHERDHTAYFKGRDLEDAEQYAREVRDHLGLDNAEYEVEELCDTPDNAA